MNVKQFTRRDDISEQACEWISRIDRGLVDDEQQELQRWLAQSQTHRKILFDMAALWDNMNVLTHLQGAAPVIPLQRRSSLPRRSRLLGVSAACMALFLVGWIGWITSQTSSPQVQVAQKFTTVVGQQKTVSLPDGSSIHLNTDTQILVTYDDKKRRIALYKGEAHFTVASDKQRPFTVVAGQNAVTAVGTAFNVQLLQEQSVELIVTEGKVLVSDISRLDDKDAFDAFMSNQEAVEGELVFSGQKLLMTKQPQQALAVDEGVIRQDLAWQEGMLMFNGQSLQEALHEIERYTNVVFLSAEPELLGTEVSGYFRVGDVTGLLRALEQSFNIGARRQGNEITLYRLTSADNGA